MHHGVVFGERYATHYYRGDRRPFQSLSEVGEGDLAIVLAGLAGGSRRRFGPHYLPLRRATEAHARDLFIAAGGQPERPHPHYFVLGQSSWFRGLYDDPREVRIRLSQLGSDITSFTWTDSITALGLGQRLGVPQPAEEWKRRLYRLDQLDLAVADALVVEATDGYEGHQTQLLDFYVEIQLWADHPVAHYLSPKSFRARRTRRPAKPLSPGDVSDEAGRRSSAVPKGL